MDADGERSKERVKCLTSNDFAEYLQGAFREVHILRPFFSLGWHGYRVVNHLLFRRYFRPYFESGLDGRSANGVPVFASMTLF